MTDTIHIKGVRGCGVHGVLAEEKLRAQPFAVDVEVKVEPAAADSIECTASYADVAADALAVVGGESADLVETLAGRIAERVLAHGALRTVVIVYKPEAPVGVPFSNVSVIVRRDGPLVDDGMIRRAVLALRSNLGDGRAHLNAAIEAFDAPDLYPTVASDYLSTDPLLVPGQGPQPRYTNAMATVTTAMSPLALLAKLQRIEVCDGRVCERRWGSWTISLDIVDVKGVASVNPRLTLPHPHAGEHLFVLRPWAQIELKATLNGVPIASLIEKLRR